MLQDGQTLGEFDILGRLGQGGMGAVYKARQTSLDRIVALKTLQASLTSDPEFIARFRREAKAAAALNHPNLVQVHAAGETDGQHWFAMEYVEGESAKDRVKRKERLDPAEAIAIAIHIATALEYGWRKAQLIHRDIKPDNIFLSSDGEVKLGDLGLAKSAGEDQSLTLTGASMGTPHYVSPEQVEGKRDVDLRADIYSLGCTLFRLVAGKPPYRGDTAMAVMLKHVSAPIPDPQTVWPGFPAELARVVVKMMAKQPGDRQQTYDEVIADLREAHRALTGEAVPSVVAVSQLPAPSAHPPMPAPEGVQPPISSGSKSHAGRWAGIAATLTILGAAFWFGFGKFEPQLAETARGTIAQKWATVSRFFVPSSSEAWTDLIATVDVKRDSLMAPWSVVRGELQSPGDANAGPTSHQTLAFSLPNPPKSYDLRYRVTRREQGAGVVFPFVRDGAGAELRMDGGNGFTIKEAGQRKGPQEKTWLPAGETHEVLIEVRKNRVRIFFDDAVQLEQEGTLPSGQLQRPFYPEAKTKAPIIGIGICRGSITVHSAEIREVDEDRRPATPP